MTLFLRTLQTLSGSIFKRRIQRADEVIRHSFRVLPIDLDLYRHMNHAKYLNYLEAARWDLQVRSGFLKLALKRGWIGPIASVHIAYFRPLNLFQRFEITTQFIGFEEKWFYILQRIWLGEKEACRALIRGTVRQGRSNVSSAVYLAELGFDPNHMEIPPEVVDWVRAGMTSND